MTFIAMSHQDGTDLLFEEFQVGILGDGLH